MGYSVPDDGKEDNHGYYNSNTGYSSKDWNGGYYNSKTGYSSPDAK